MKILAKVFRGTEWFFRKNAEVLENRDFDGIIGVLGIWACLISPILFGLFLN